MIQKSLIKRIATEELISPEKLSGRLKKGTVVIPKNKKRSLQMPCGIGAGLRTKINANIGASQDSCNIEFELEKLKVAERFGADTVMDLSACLNLREIRKEILDAARVPLGTVPIYEVAVLGKRKYDSIAKIPESFFIKTLEGQAREGVDYFTIHAGVTLQTTRSLRKSNRIAGVVSRGGAITIDWMLKNAKENPFFAQFDEVVDIAKAFDITLSLGDGLRPGAIQDATDKPQLEELMMLGELRKKARKKGVQVIIEGPGHVPLQDIQKNVELQKKVCEGAPFYVLGPIVTDIAPGYDHITSAIGGAIAASFGADFLCYVTPAEHLRLPTLEDVKEGVIASKIAAHAADIAKKVKGAENMDAAISKARFARDWEKQFALAVDPEKCRKYRAGSRPKEKDVCTMCSDYCSLKISEECLENSVPKGRKTKGRRTIRV
ncbi:MAG: phosphomethylpyrimidine synthase ThiC [Candidatus Omnitrophica bacterium]|nr:phosphomethylpyrimidine synthase ThiC [Candidatus Omnitrophota bacterium]